MPTGSASIDISRSPAEVFGAISDITRIGEWSPECMGARWVGGATGPAVGAKFAGDNKAAVGGLTLKRWTTTSEVTACVPDESFEFIAEGYTTWRYELKPSGTGTTVTESFSFESPTGFQKFIYETVMKRSKAMVKGMGTTLAKVKSSLEA